MSFFRPQNEMKNTDNHFSKKHVLNIQPYEFYEKNYRRKKPCDTYKFYQGFKIVIDENNHDNIPTTLWEIGRYLPDDMKYYTKMFKKGSGKNPGWFCLIHLEYIQKNGDREVIPQWILCKQSQTAQDISEILIQSIINKLIGNDIAASPTICVDHTTKETYMISVMYPGFQDGWKRFYSNHNAYLLEMGLDPKSTPTERPKSVGVLNKFIQNGIGTPSPGLPYCIPAIKDFYLCMALSFFIRNFDFHFGNIGCIFRNSTGSIVRDPSTIQRLSNYIQLLEKCIQDKNLEGYQTVLQYFNDAKKNLSIEECFVLIDCGWAGAHWEQHIVNTLHGDNGFESNNILLHFPFLEPTNHFNDLSKYIKYTEEFAENLLFVCKQFHSSNILQLKPFLHQLLNELEKYYGKTGLKKYMQFIGAPIQADLEIKENIIHYLTTRAFPTEILSAKQLAFKIKLSVCFPEKGEWKKTSEGYQWEGQKKFDFDSEKFAKLIDLYAHYQPNFLKKVTPDFFIGEGQKEFQLKLFELFKNKLKKQLKIDSYTQWSKMTHQKIETQTLSKSEWIFRLRF